MKNLIYIYIVFVASISLLSCKKDDVEEVTVSNNYTVTVDGDELKDGDVWETSSVGEEGNMKLVFTNTSSSKIYLRMKIESIVGNPQSYQLCMGSCYTEVNEGISYPSSELVSTDSSYNPNIPSLPALNHIECTDDRSESFSFNIKLYQCDENGDELSSKKIVRFTFKYVAP